MSLDSSNPAISSGKDTEERETLMLFLCDYLTLARANLCPLGNQILGELTEISGWRVRELLILKI